MNLFVKFIIANFAVCLVQSAVVHEKCSVVCTEEYNPICGQDNTGNYKTFSNKCTFEYEQCEHRGAEWKLVANKACSLRQTDDQKCPTVCPLMLAPVCGIDNTGNHRTFDNECEFKKEQCENRGTEWRIISHQDCRLRRSVPKIECPKKCTRELMPVCGVDNTGNFRTFTNECEFKTEECENRGAEWKLIAKQDCRLRETDDQQCPIVCPLLFSPVCGMDNTGNHRTFENECVFKKEQCENRGAEWRIISHQNCRLRRSVPKNECPKKCTRELMPVCGVDNTGNFRTFTNECEFKTEECENRGAEWKLVAKQDCRLRETDDQQCPMVCPLLFSPVCGMDNTGNHRTFENECVFKKEQCENRGAVWRIISHQDCRLKRSIPKNECPKKCTRELMPVCGVDNTGNFRTFANECEFKTEECENRGAEWKLVAKQDCHLRETDDQQCPTVCPLLLSPVCGMDNTGNHRTFENECVFKKEQCENRGAEWRIISHQNCRLRRSVQKTECPKKCSREFMPVCGVDNTGNFRTFNNECEFKTEECENRGAEWKIVSKQDCRLRN